MYPNTKSKPGRRKSEHWKEQEEYRKQTRRGRKGDLNVKEDRVKNYRKTKQLQMS